MFILCTICNRIANILCCSRLFFIRGWAEGRVSGDGEGPLFHAHVSGDDMTAISLCVMQLR